MLETMEVPGNDHAGIKASPLKNLAGSIAQLKCIYTSACGIGNQKEELETKVQQENCGISGHHGNSVG